MLLPLSTRFTLAAVGQVPSHFWVGGAYLNTSFVFAHSDIYASLSFVYVVETASHRNLVYDALFYIQSLYPSALCRPLGRSLQKMVLISLTWNPFGKLRPPEILRRHYLYYVKRHDRTVNQLNTMCPREPSLYLFYLYKLYSLRCFPTMHNSQRYENALRHSSRKVPFGGHSLLIKYATKPLFIAFG